jgi:hypothetical protein
MKLQCGIVAVVADPHLRLNEHLVAGDAGVTNAFTDFTLIEIGSGGIDEPIADRQGVRDGPHGFDGRALEHAEPEGGKFNAVVQRDGRRDRRGVCGHDCSSSRARSAI